MASGWQALLRKELTVFGFVKYLADCFELLYSKEKMPDLMLSTLASNFRMKTKVKLGEPSNSVFRKFYDDFKNSSEYQSERAMADRKRFHCLIIRDGAMGDVLMTTPVVREIYMMHSGAVLIDVATHAGNVFLNNPYVNNIISPNTLSKGVRNYDVVFNLNDVYERMPNVHPIDAYAHCAFGSRDFDKKIEIFSTQIDSQYVNKIANELDLPFLVVHCLRHDWPNREINSHIWRELLCYLAMATNLKIVFIGNANDYFLDTHENFIDFRGRCTVQQLQVLINKSVGFLGADSGPAHIAASTNAAMAIFYTCADDACRKPLRGTGQFFPIIPEVECYGCLTRSPIARPGYFCERQDNLCTRAFDVNVLKKELVQFFS